MNADEEPHSHSPTLMDEYIPQVDSEYDEGSWQDPPNTPVNMDGSPDER